MEGIPDYIIPDVLSYLRLRDVHRCACISRVWKQCVQELLAKIRRAAENARSKVYTFFFCSNFLFDYDLKRVQIFTWDCYTATLVFSWFSPPQNLCFIALKLSLVPVLPCNAAL